jgi:pyruvate kinase
LLRARHILLKNAPASPYAKNMVVPMPGGEAVDETSNELRDLLADLKVLREQVIRDGGALLESWGANLSAMCDSQGAINLSEYIALRQRDISSLQMRLARYGLSSLGRSEAKAVVVLDAVIATLGRLCGESTNYPPLSSMRAGEDALNASCDLIFGTSHLPRHANVIATLPSDAATDPALVQRLMKAGMDCARINCAHDDAAAWEQMIAHIRRAEETLRQRCRILMDLAGPKCRIESISTAEKFRLFRGDHFRLAASLMLSTDGAITITPTFPEVIDALEVGSEVWINDGKIGARVVAREKGLADLEVISARAKGERLKPEKGMNFPTSELQLAPLTPKDFADLDFIATNADLVGYSFVQRPSDVVLLQDHLAARRGKPPQPIILKIETPLAVRNLPRLILQSLAQNPTAVMIARGDLAVELGFARLSEMQEEILWLCEAAHVPVIWATQVLDQFVREGVLSRAETTDAAMAQRADGVMLNKGPYLAEGVAFLRDVLSRMDRHYDKKFARYPALHAWDRSEPSEAVPGAASPPDDISPGVAKGDSGHYG